MWGGGGKERGSHLTRHCHHQAHIKYEMGDAVTCFDCSVSDFVPAEGNVTVDNVCYC